MDSINNESVITLAILFYLVNGVMGKITDSEVKVGSQIEVVAFNKIMEKCNAVTQ